MQYPDSSSSDKAFLGSSDSIPCPTPGDMSLNSAAGLAFLSFENNSTIFPRRACSKGLGEFGIRFAEGVLRLKNIRVATGLKELLLLTHPLRVVDTVNVVLNLKNDTSVLGDDTGEVGVILETLGLLQGEVTLLLSAAVELESVLVGVDVYLNSRPRGRQGCNRTLGAPIILAELATVDGVAVTLQILVVLLVANHLGLAPEIVDGSLLVGNDVASGNENVVGGNTLTTVGHVERVVGDGVGLVVGKAVKVPVGVAGEHDGSLLGGCQCDNLDIPVVAGQSVGHVRDNLSGETLLSIRVNNGEGDAGVCVGHNSEVAVVPAIGSSVKSIGTLGAVSNTVGVSSRDTSKMRVTLVNAVVGSVVETSNDVSGDTELIVDQEVGDGGAVWDEGSLDTVSREPVFTILVRALAFLSRKGEREESSNDSSLEQHDCGGRVETEQPKMQQLTPSFIELTDDFEYTMRRRRIYFHQLLPLPIERIQVHVDAIS
ncbi:hypothetical protein HG530_000456 [Fusarium avenaceum]|nr:hypothetical protein HG530_000456 [Fusarium avenaceum]